MLKCLAAASRRNLSCQQQKGEEGQPQQPADGGPCCDLLLNKFGTVEPDVIKEIFKQRIQDRVMRRGQQQQDEEHQPQQQLQIQQHEQQHIPRQQQQHPPQEAHYSEPPVNERRQGGDLFGKRVNEGQSGGGGIAHQRQRTPQNRDRVRQRLRSSQTAAAAAPATTQRQRLRPVATTTTGWFFDSSHLEKNMTEVNLPTSNQSNTK